MLAFIGLFIVTCWSLLKNDVLGLFWPSLHGPLPIWNPVKLLANVSAIALIFGAMVSCGRTDAKQKVKVSPAAPSMTGF